MNSNKLNDEERAQYARFLLTSRQRPQPFITVGWPDSLLKLIPGLLGLPIEREERNIQNPLLIGAMIASFIVVFIYSINHDLQAVVDQFGFLASKWSRNGYTTPVSSFFIHAGWLHLIGNSYYFYIFGDDVEDELSTWRFLLLLFGSHFLGIFAQILIGGATHLPIVGASAGISGLMGYYMVRFPQRRISYMIVLLFNAVWVHVPAYMALLWKFAWDLILAGITVASVSGGGRMRGQRCPAGQLALSGMVIEIVFFK